MGEIEIGDLLFEKTSIGNYRSLTHLINKGGFSKIQDFQNFGKNSVGKFGPVLLSFVKKNDVMRFIEIEYKNRYEQFLENNKIYVDGSARFGIKLLNETESDEVKKFAVVND